MSTLFDHESDNNETMQSLTKETSQGINKERLNVFFKRFFTSEASKDPVLSGYVKEIVQSLISKRKDLMIDYILTDETILNNLVHSVGMQSTASLLLIIVGVEASTFNEFDDEDTKKQEYTLERLSVF